MFPEIDSQRAATLSNQCRTDATHKNWAPNEQMPHPPAHLLSWNSQNLRRARHWELKLQQVPDPQVHISTYMVFSDYNSHLQIANKIQHHWEKIRTILHSPNGDKDPDENEAPSLYTKPITLADSPTRSKEHAKVCLLAMPATLHTCNICCILFHGDANFWFDLLHSRSLQNILN
jgi:hypothetical protein